MFVQLFPQFVLPFLLSSFFVRGDGVCVCLSGERKREVEAHGVVHCGVVLCRTGSGIPGWERTILRMLFLVRRNDVGWEAKHQKYKGREVIL